VALTFRVRALADTLGRLFNPPLLDRYQKLTASSNHGKVKRVPASHYVLAKRDDEFAGLTVNFMREVDKAQRKLPRLR
jgi:hypothetical protein